MLILQADHWRGVYENGGKIENPTWKEIKEAITTLNQKEKTQVVVQREDWSSISIGGGNGCYHVCFTTSDERFFVLRQPKTPTLQTDKELVVGGQVGKYPSETIVSLELVLQAVNTYINEGTRDQTLMWIED